MTLDILSADITGENKDVTISTLWCLNPCRPLAAFFEVFHLERMHYLDDFNDHLHQCCLMEHIRLPVLIWRLAIRSILHYEILPYCILSCRYPTTITYPLVPQTEMSLWNALLATLLIQQSHWVTLDRCQNTVSCHSSDSCLMWFVLLLHLPLYWSVECSVAQHVGHRLHVVHGSQDCGPSGHPHF